MKTEKKIVDLLSKYFKRKGFKVLQKVRVPPREIDLVLLDPNSLELIAIEAKLKDWKKVIAQSIINQLYSHYSIIAMPEKYQSKIPRGVLEEYGIGLISIKEKRKRRVVSFEAIPKLSNRINRVFKREVYKYFK